MTRNIVRRPKLSTEHDQLDAAILALIEKGIGKPADLCFKLRDRPENEDTIRNRIRVLGKRGVIRHIDQVTGWRINTPTRRA